MSNSSCLDANTGWASRFITINGIRTHYLEAGAAGAPKLVLIHGGGAGADAVGNWAATIKRFSRDFHVFAPDMVGFGDSDCPDPTTYVYSQTARIDHLEAFVDALQLAGAAFVGNSMGGATALGVAMRDPKAVGSLVLMGSAGLNSSITEALKPIVLYDFSLDGMRRLVRALTTDRFEASEELLEYRYQRAIRPKSRSAYEAIMGWIKAQGGLYYAEDDIRRVTTRTLVLNGKVDLVVPLSNAYRFLDLLPNSWGYIIPHCGHWAMLESPEEFARVTTQFVLNSEAA